MASRSTSRNSSGVIFGILLAAGSAFPITPRANAKDESGAVRAAINAAAVSKEAAGNPADSEKSAVLNRSWATGEELNRPGLRPASFSKKEPPGLVGSLKTGDPGAPLAGEIGSLTAATIAEPAAAPVSPAPGLLERLFEAGKNMFGGILGRGEDVPEANDADAGSKPSGEDEERAELIDKLISGILATGASQKARDEAARIMREILKDMPLENIRNLVDENLTVAIIPEGKKLTDLPQWADLKGQYTIDGRLWDDAPGIASYSGGSLVITMTDRNLAETVPLDLRPPRQVFAHEFGHAVRYALPAETRKRLENHFNEQKKFINDYAAINSNEYFAEATAIWFGANKWGAIPLEPGSPDWFAKNDPGAYSILEDIYGPPGKI